MITKVKVFMFLITFFSLGAFAEAPPERFDKQTFIYKVITKVAVDFDLLFKDMGIKVHSCQVITKSKPLAYDSLGHCLFVAIDNSFKTKEKTQIKLWVLNDKGQYLSPLIIQWKNSQSNWIAFISEFIYLSMENFLKHFVKSNESTVPCLINEEKFLSNDMGNFLGDLEISTISPWTLANYFPTNAAMTLPDIKNSNLASLRVATPERIKGKRIYEAQVDLHSSYEVSNTNNSLQIRVRTNFNFIAQRESCVQGKLNYTPRAGVLP